MWVTGTLVERIDWNDKLFSLKIKAEIEPFTAGQFIKLSEIRDERRIARAYSLVNAEHESLLEVLAVRVEEGQLSPNLHELQIGQPIEVSARATGYMILDEVPGSRDLWLLSTGTAVGPFISMLRGERIWKQYERIFLAYGVRESADLAYREVLDTIAREHPDHFQWQPLVTRESFHGNLGYRIPQALDSGQLQQIFGAEIDPAHSQVMLCGNPAMTRETSEWLQGCGLLKNLRRKPGHITQENYW